MSSNSTEIFGWRRLWAPVKLDQGQVRQPATTGEDRDERAGQPLDNLSHYLCLILLGPPGSGKTTEISAAYREATNQGDPSYFLSLVHSDDDDESCGGGSPLRITPVPCGEDDERTHDCLIEYLYAADITRHLPLA